MNLNVSLNLLLAVQEHSSGTPIIQADAQTSRPEAHRLASPRETKGGRGHNTTTRDTIN